MLISGGVSVPPGLFVMFIIPCGCSKYGMGIGFRQAFDVKN